MPRHLLLPTLLLAASCSDPSGQPPAVAPDLSSGPQAGLCDTSFSYDASEDAFPDAVFVMGAFNGWRTDATPLVETTPGHFEAQVPLPPGAHPYRLVEFYAWSEGGYENEVCDPNAELIHCEEGYKEPWETDWRHDCASPAATACNSMVKVANCALPQLSLDSLDIDRSGGRVSVAASATPGQAASRITGVRALLDGADHPVDWDGSVARLELSDLSPSRHTLRLVATDDAGNDSEDAFVPLWMDASGDDAWREGAIYFAFVDRFANGDPSLDRSEGTTLEIGDYMGGDLQGVIDRLPYLDELGVRTLWLSNPQDNAEGAWDGDCDETYAGYHAYWPDQAREVEDHFGNADTLHALVEAAHARNMRVIMDWVANHVHQDHPYYAEHADDWFNAPANCRDSSGGQSNWDRIPESCWFAPYLPDIDYAQPEILDLMVEDALWWVKTYDLDGLRVDAVKHMPHSVAWNLEARIRREVEHRQAGGDEQFWTVGETFDGAEKIAEYLNDGDGRLGLDGQFDFPMYYTMQAVFGSMSADLSALEGAAAAAQASYGDALMSSFLGNHDVMRFTTEATEGWQPACQEGVGVRSAGLAWDPHIYTRMRLAWTFLFTQPAVPLVYYGDELGIPGYSDPDNRQPLWWFADLPPGAGVEALAAQVDGDRAALLRTVAALGQARLDHPAMYRGSTIEWWREPTDAPDLWAYARKDADSGDEVIVILNRSGRDASLTNGLAYAGLSPGSTFEDLLSGDTFTATGDSLTVWAPAWTPRLLLRR